MCDPASCKWWCIVVSLVCTFILGIVTAIIGETNTWKQDDGVDGLLYRLGDMARIYDDPSGQMLAFGVFYILLACLFCLLGLCHCCMNHTDHSCRRIVLICYMVFPSTVVFAALLFLCVYAGSWEMKRLEYRDDMQKLLYKGYDNDGTTMDILQANLNCCGVVSYTDWNHTRPCKDNGEPSTCTLPKSCCTRAADDRYHMSCTQLNVHNLSTQQEAMFIKSKGCVDALTDRQLFNYAHLGISVILFMVINGIGIIFACLLYRQYKHEDSQAYRTCSQVL